MSRPPPKFVNVDADFDKRSLKAMCIRKATKMVNNMTDIGDYRLTYPIARHFLVHIKSAHKLAEIEHHSPHIKGDDAEIWQKLIRKDFPKQSEASHYEPEDDEGLDWYAVYMRYQEEEEHELEAAKAILKQSYGAAMGQYRDNTSKKVEAKYMPKLPRDPKLLANAGIPLSRRNYSGNNSRPKPGFLGHATAGTRTHRNLVELARREAAAQVAMRKQAKQYIPETKSQITKAPAALIEEHESEDRKKRLALPPMPEVEKPKRIDPYEARVARAKALQAERAARDKALQQSKKEKEKDSHDMADLFGDDVPAPSERTMETRPSIVQLPGGGTARKLPVKRSPTLGPARPRLPPKKVDIFFTAKKKPVSPPLAPKPDTSSTGAIPNLSLNAPRNGFTPARPPPRMTSMAQGARGAINPGGTKASRKAVEMKSMRPVNVVADRQGAGRPSAAASLRPVPSAALPAVTTAARPAASQPRSGGVTSMLAGLVAKQDAERSSRPSTMIDRPSPSLKRSAPAESPAPAAKRLHTDFTLSRSSPSSHNRPQPQPQRSAQPRPQPQSERPSPSMKRSAPN